MTLPLVVIISMVVACYTHSGILRGLAIGVLLGCVLVPIIMFLIPG